MLYTQPYYYSSHFTDKEAEACWVKCICSSLQRTEMRGLLVHLSQLGPLLSPSLVLQLPLSQSCRCEETIPGRLGKSFRRALGGSRALVSSLLLDPRKQRWVWWSCPCCPPSGSPWEWMPPVLDCGSPWVSSRASACCYTWLLHRTPHHAG